jgi:hypothetical protein
MLGKAHRYIYLGCLVLMAISLPVSTAMPNILGGVLVGNWLLEWNWKEKWNLLQQNKLAIAMAALFFCFGYTFVGTCDARAGWLDLLTKTPILYLPVILGSTRKPEPHWQRFLLLAFSITTSVAAAICIIVMQSKGILDVRDGGLFISHIRFSICAVLAIVFCVHYAFRRATYSLPVQLGCLLMTAWLVAFLFSVQVATGILLLTVVVIITLIYSIFMMEKSALRTLVFCGSGIAGVVLITCFSVVTYQYYHLNAAEEANLPSHTAQGHAYTHCPDYLPDGVIVENGHKIGLYLCEEELRAGWAQRSRVPYDTVRKGLIRYLNSEGLHKDAQGLAALDDEDITHIENHIANSAYVQRFGLKKMLYPTYFSFSLYQLNGTTENSSVLQRIELWKAASSAIGQRPFTGYGMGCNKAAVDRELAARQSQLHSDMGAHNQFLTYTLMGGIPLAILFIVWLVAPFFDKSRRKTLIYTLFWLCLVISMLFEDTLETVTGINLFLFFSSFFLFASDPKEV